MPIQEAVAKSTAHDLLAAVGKFFARAQVGARELFTGRWVTASTVDLKTGVSTKVFRNGATVIKRPGLKHEVQVPQSWLDGSESWVKQLRQGTWVKTETWHAGQETVDRTFANGLKVQVIPAKQVLPSMVKAAKALKI